MTSHEDSGTAAFVWRSVIEAIYDGHFAAGQRLTEISLTEKFGVSRSSVREALTRLAAEGAVELQRHRGAVVRKAGKAELLQTLAVLDALIRLAATLAATNVGDPAVREIAERELRHFALPRPAYSLFELARERNQFYRNLLRMAGNLELSRLMSCVHVHSLRVQLQGRPPSSLFADYVAILAAILAGDPGRAGQAARAHVARNVEEVNALPDSAKDRAQRRQRSVVQPQPLALLAS